MRRRHRMRFGAEVGEGGVDFRLWAPSARRVELAREGHEPTEMSDEGEGWWRLAVEGAGHGDRYGFRIDSGLTVPDPASRFQPDDVHGLSEVIDPRRHEWAAGEDRWTGRSWDEAVIYELHVGTFSEQGTFAATAERLEHLVDLGVTAVELMPVADFPGRYNWGYDGVQPFAPDARYGRPGALKALVERAHALGLMVLLDVVYNHLGPEGNYLHVYAKPVFTDRYQTPWGAAIAYDGGLPPVRELFIDNALYWIDEYGFDGLRLDAVHAIFDRSEPHILTELAGRAAALAERRGRRVHLVLENDANETRHLARGYSARGYTAQWNDDLHHALHVLLTGETEGYYADYAERPLQHLGRCLAEGFAYQGQPSPYRDGALRGEPSAELPPSCFVAFLQNHDQVGNRALGERIDRLAPAERVEAALALLLLSPQPPLLFMGQEWGSQQPFLFFCDFSEELRDAVRDGRRAEFARFSAFADPATRERIPDCCAPENHRASVLDWVATARPAGAARLGLHRRLLRLRRERIVPLLPRLVPGAARARVDGDDGSLEVAWPVDDGRSLILVANLGDTAIGIDALGALARASLDDPACRIYHSAPRAPGDALPPWSAHWLLAQTNDGAPREDPDD